MAKLKINQSTIETIIFDFDGTLAKLNIDFRKMREAIAALICSYGIAKDQLYTDLVLEMIDAAFEILKQHSERQAKKFFNEANAIVKNIEIKAAYNGELFDHSRKLLDSLKSQDISCGIITRNCAKAVKIIFPDILSNCSVLICRDDVNNVKPHPEHLNMALKELGGSAKNTLMIGDHPLDIKTGLNAGTKTCGVLTGRCKRNDFIKAGADLILPQAADILDIIK
jgi:phosphoglycolate phosphatase